MIIYGGYIYIYILYDIYLSIYLSILGLEFVLLKDIF